jgi:hypothetical protein
MRKTIKLEENRILAVEGKDECNFFKALIKHEDIKDVQIIDIGGKDKFTIELPLLINLEGFTDIHTLGFIRDAEKDQASSAFSSICKTLENNKLPAPQVVNTIYSEQNLKIGIFIMPNNVDEGMLEDLCLKSIKDEPVLECVDKYIECCLHCSPENEKTNISKAKIQTYLSCRKPLVNSLGVAALKGHWDFEKICFSEIKFFLHNLFDEKTI